MSGFVSFDLSEPHFSDKIFALKSIDKKLYSDLIGSFITASAMAWNSFEQKWQWHFHSSPHFSEPKVWGDCTPPNLPIRIYAALNPDAQIITPLVFWQPQYLR